MRSHTKIKPKLPKPGTRADHLRLRRDLRDCKYCKKVFDHPSQIGGHVRYCHLNPQREINIEKEKERLRNNPRKLSEDTKKKISESRKIFLDANPHMVPYVLNHYSKGPSYPEKYFSNLLKTEGLEFEEQYQVGRYTLDFAFLSRKIDLEIDGDQHYTDQRIVKSDETRTRFLESEQWKVLRVKWSTYQSFSNDEKKDYIAKLIAEITGP